MPSLWKGDAVWLGCYGAVHSLGKTMGRGDQRAVGHIGNLGSVCGYPHREVNTESLSYSEDLLKVWSISILVNLSCKDKTS